jgi:signal transduction histidine kinase
MKTTLTYLLLLFCFEVFAQNESVITLKDKNDLFLVGKQTYFLEDVEGKMTIEDILKSENQAKFVLQQNDIFSHPATSSAFWFKITVQNTSEEDAWLEVGSTSAWYIDFYAPDSTGKYGKPHLTGTMRPESLKFYDLMNVFWLPLNKVTDTQPKTYYLRITEELLFEVPLQVGTIRSLYKNNQYRDFLTAGFVGIMIVMFLYNLFIYISIKDHIYALYLLYVLTSTFMVTFFGGYALFPDPQWEHYYFAVWNSPTYIAVILFNINYLQMGKHLPWAKITILFILFILSGVLPILSLFGWVKPVQISNLVQMLVFVAYMVCITSAYYLVYKGYRSPRFYALGWTFMIGSVLIFLSAINGALPYNIFTRNVMYFGLSIEVCMFSLALADRINTIRKEKELSQQALLAQTQENEKLVKEQNVILEQKVEERTKAILEQKEEIEMQASELQKNSTFKDKLFAIIAHDLRSPMASLRNAIEILDPKILNEAELEIIKKELGKQFNATDTTLQNLLIWAKDQMQGEAMKVQNLAISELVDENIAFLTSNIENKKITLKNKISAEKQVFADANHVRTILRNLIANALKFTNTGGEIKIFCTETEENINIAVADNGQGMSKEQQEMLFTHKHFTTRGTEGEKGTGLGLNLVKNLVEKNEGKIWVESTEGKGSTFWVSLPIHNKLK